MGDSLAAPFYFQTRVGLYRVLLSFDEVIYVCWASVGQGRVCTEFAATTGLSLRCDDGVSVVFNGLSNAILQRRHEREQIKTMMKSRRREERPS